MLHEISRNHDADGVKTAKERDGDAVEAHCGNGACRLEVFDTREIENAAPRDASAPEIAIVRIILRLSFIPAYFAANLLLPVAFSSYPKVVLFITMRTIIAIIIVKIIAIVTYLFLLKASLRRRTE